MNPAFFLSALALSLSASANVSKPDSLYTQINQKAPGYACFTTDLQLDEEGYSREECPGWAGYRVFIESGDARNWLAIRTPSGKEYSFWHLGNGYFPAVGAGALEWRFVTKTQEHAVYGGDGTADFKKLSNMVKPYALIVRVVTQKADDSEGHNSDLAVISLNAAYPCLVGYVKAGTKQNEMARAMADSLGRSGTCKK